MSAYYNEFDPKAAAWLRELIKAGLIADGEVDERSIVDVRAVDLRGFRQCHFFAGIGGWSYALRLAGWSDDRAAWTGSCPCQLHAARRAGATSLRISGLRFDGLFPPVGLVSYLASRLPRRGLGSMASAMTWKEWATPSGRLFCRLAVSGSIMLASGFTLRARPTAKANQAAPSMRKWRGCRGLIVTPETWCRRMGYPIAWLSCGDLAMQSFRKSLRPSSKQQARS